MDCTRATHEALKANEDQLASLTVSIGIQRDTDGSVMYELRNCVRCGSSLAIEPAESASAQATR